MSSLAFHGIGAYAYHLRDDLRGLKKSVDTMLFTKTGRPIEVCGADRPIGQFGLVLSGDIRAAFSRDIWSCLTYYGKRVVSHFAYTPVSKLEATINAEADEGAPLLRVAENPSHSEWLELAQGALVGQGARHYSECWITPAGIAAVWVKPWASKRVKKLAAILAKNRGVPCLEIAGTDRIWDIESQLGSFYYGQKPYCPPTFSALLAA